MITPPHSVQVDWVARGVGMLFWRLSYCTVFIQCVSYATRTCALVAGTNTTTMAESCAERAASQGSKGCTKACWSTTGLSLRAVGAGYRVSIKVPGDNAPSPHAFPRGLNANRANANVRPRAWPASMPVQKVCAQSCRRTRLHNEHLTWVPPRT